MSAVGSISTVAANGLLNRYAGGTAYTPPASLEVAALTVMCDADGVGGVEVVAADYSRISVDNDHTTFTTSTARSIANAIALTFAAALSNWGHIAGVAFYDAADHTTLWGYAEFATHRNITVAKILTIAIGDCVIVMPIV